MKSFQEWFDLREAKFIKPTPPNPRAPYDPNRNKINLSQSNLNDIEPIKELPILLGNNINIYSLADAFGGKVVKQTDDEILIKYPKNVYGSQSELRYYIHQDGKPAIDTAHYNPKQYGPKPITRKEMDTNDTDTLLKHLKKYVVKP